MNTNQFSSQQSPEKRNGAEGTNQVLTLRSGTGAPIFEPGPHTRIRRNPVRAIASLTWEGGPREVFGQIRDVSLTGCLLRTESTIPVDSDLDITITLVGARSEAGFEVRATVRRQTTIDGRRGYGLEFLFPSTRHRRAVQALYSETAR